MRNCLRVMLAVVLAMMSIAGIVGVATAATGTGSITGYVYIEGGTTPIAGGHVVAWDWSTGARMGEAHALTSGLYTITGLPTGSYRIRADYDRYLPETYNNGTPEPVAVVDGSATSGKNFSLTPGSSISGYVYDDNVTPNPIPIAHVTVYDNDTWERVADGYASDNGFYCVTTGTGSGNYFVGAQLHGSAEEFYDNVSTTGAATQVSVTAGNDTPNINFTLSSIGWISGTVYRPDGVTPLTPATIAAYWTDNGVWAASSGTGDDGFFYINLPPETYRILATSSGYVPQWSDNVQFGPETGNPVVNPYWSAAEVITVTDNETPGHDFVMRTVQAVTTNAASDVTTTTATLNGNLDSLGAPTSDNVSFEWGLTTGYGSNTTPVAKTTTGAFSAPVSGLTPNTTYHFRAKAVGNVTTYGTDMTLTTSPLGAPTVTTDNAGGVTTTSAALNGTLNLMGTAGTVNVSFEWGTSENYTNVTTPVGKTAAPDTFTASLTGLTPKTTYHFRAKAVGDGTVYGNDVTFTTLTIAPSLTTDNASSVTTTSATLNGNLTSKGTAANVVVSFVWGTTTGGPYTGSTDNQTKSATGVFSANLSGLTAGTTYYYKAKVVGDGTVLGDEKSFTALTPPSVTTAAATVVTDVSATLNGNLASKGSADNVSVSFEWGTTTSYGSETTPQAVAVGAFSASLTTGLSANTTYHFRAKAVGDGPTVYGDDMTFTTTATPDTTAPVISSVTASAFTDSGATIAWSTNEGATSQVEYGLTAEYGSSTPLADAKVTSHSVNLTGLEAGKTYHYRVKSKDAAGNERVSADDTFKTTGGGGGMPAWAWVLIALAAVGAVGGAAFLIKMKMGQKPADKPSGK